MTKNKFMSVSLANKSVVERITNQITNAIINGELKPGDKIPTEIELCENFGVGRNSTPKFSQSSISVGNFIAGFNSPFMIGFVI